MLHHILPWTEFIALRENYIKLFPHKEGLSALEQFSTNVVP
jgi:hypothetical protein